MSAELKLAMNRINDEFFDFEELPEISWSKGRIQPKYRKLTLGTYDPQKNHIRIHPLFRVGKLPEFVRDYVIYHEMLHYEDRARLMKRRRRGKRRSIHNRDFHHREKAYPRSDEAIRYVREVMKNGFE